MKKKIGKIVALFMAAGLLVNSFFWSAANEGDNGGLRCRAGNPGKQRNSAFP